MTTYRFPRQTSNVWFNSGLFYAAEDYRRPNIRQRDVLVACCISRAGVFYRRQLACRFSIIGAAAAIVGFDLRHRDLENASAKCCGKYGLLLVLGVGVASRRSAAKPLACCDSASSW